MDEQKVMSRLDDLWSESKESISIDQFKKILSSWTPQLDDDSELVNVLRIFTDGGCRGNTGASLGGWGVYSPTLNLESYGVDDETTNNKMELKAVYEALRMLFTRPIAIGQWDTIRIYSDSSYVVNTFNSWVWNWIKNGEIMSKKNSELIMSIASLIKLYKINEFTIQFVKVKGHSDCVGNAVADKLVNEAMDTHSNKLIPLSIKDIAETLLSYVYDTAEIWIDDNTIHIIDPGWSRSPKFAYYNSLTQKLESLNIDVEVIGGMNTDNLINIKP